MGEPKKEIKILYDGQFQNNNIFKNAKVNYSIPSYNETSFIGNISELGKSKFDTELTWNQIENINEVRGERQPWLEQAGAMLNQAVIGSVIGQTIQGIGTLIAIPDVITGDYSMDNPIYQLGKGISDWAAEETPIYQTGERFSDSGYWFQGLTSAASAASFILPGWGFTKALGALGKATQMGTTATKIMQTVGSAVGMRHIEGAMESNEVRENTLRVFDDKLAKGEISYDKILESIGEKELNILHAQMQAEINSIPLQLPDPETGLPIDNTQVIEQVRQKYKDIITKKARENIANSAAGLTYVADYANIVFDLVQMGAILKPFSRLTRNVGKLPYKAAVAEGIAPKTWYGKAGMKFMDGARIGAAELTEGIEEQINYISAQEGERYGKILMGLEKEDGSTLGDRIASKYAKEDEFWDSFIFGAIGGVGFRLGAKALGMDESSALVKRKVAEMQGRSESLKQTATTINDIINSDKYTADEKKTLLKEQAAIVGHELGLRGSMAQNVDRTLAWLERPELAKELESLGFGDETTVREIIPIIKKNVETAENLYKKHYTGLYGKVMDDNLRNVLIQERMALDADILDNRNTIQQLQTEYTKLINNDTWFATKGMKPENVAIMNMFAAQMTIENIKKEITSGKFTKEEEVRIKNVLTKLQEDVTNSQKTLQELQKNATEAGQTFTLPSFEDITGIDNRIISNVAHQKFLTRMNEVLGDEVVKKNSDKQVKEDLKKAEELRKERERIIKEADIARKKAEAEAKANERKKGKTTTTETTWEDVISKAVNEKELDAIIDQMDKAGVSTNELLDRVAKKRKSLKVTPKEEVIEPTRQVEIYKKGDLVYDDKGNEFIVNSIDSLGNIIDASDTIFGGKLVNKESVSKNKPVQPKEKFIDNEQSISYEQKVADIERRRQELESSREIETLYDLGNPIAEDSKEIISKIEEANKLRKDAQEKSEQAAKETNEEKRIALNSDADSLYEKAQILDKEVKKSRDIVINNTPIKQAINSTWSIGQKLLNKIKLAAKSNEWVSSMPISKEEFAMLEDATKRLAVKKMGEVTSNSEVIPDILLIEEINAKYDAELAALEQEFASKNADDVLDTVDETDVNDGDNPDTVTTELENEEINTENFKVVSALKVNYRGTDFTVKGKNTVKETVGYEKDLSEFAIAMADWVTLPNGSKVELSLDTNFVGEVYEYKDGKRIIDPITKEPIKVTKRYDELPDMEKPIRVQMTDKNGNKQTIGYLPTLNWVSARNDKGYENIAEGEDGNNPLRQIEIIKEFRQRILDAGANATHIFTIEKGYGQLTVNPEKVKVGKRNVAKKQPLSEAIPNINNGEYYEGALKPLAIYDRGFNTSSTEQFPTDNLTVKPENLTALLSKKAKSTGGVFLMFPSAVRGKYIPRALTVPKLDGEIADALIHTIKLGAIKSNELTAEQKKEIKAIKNIFQIDISTRSGLRNFLKEFIYLAASEGNNKNNDKGFPRVVFNVKDSEIEIRQDGIITGIVQLNNINSKQSQSGLTKLTEALKNSLITVRKDRINSNKPFGIPSVKQREDGTSYLDIASTTANQYLMDRLQTDIVELTAPQSGKPVYTAQPVITLKEGVDNIPIKPKEPITLDDKPKKAVPKNFGKGKLETRKSQTISKQEDIVEDMSISETINFLPLQGNEVLYKNYNLLNKEGKLKVIKSKKIGDKWVKALNKSPYYHFALRPVANDGNYRIFILAEPKMQPSEDFSISELQTQSTKANSQGLLITDEDYTFDADKQRQVVGNIGYLVYTDLLEAAKTGEVRRVTEAFKNAKAELQNYKDALDHMASLETEGELLLLVAEYPVYSHIDSLDKAKFLAEEVGRILKDEVWNQFQEQVKVELKAKGIVVKNEKLLDLSVLTEDELAALNLEDVIEDTDSRSEKNFSIETFQIDPKNTASINVKLMLSKIEDTTVNYLGLNSYIPFDTVFDELKMMLAPLEGDLDAYIKEIEQIANNNSSKGYLNNLITYLKDPNTATQIKNNFVAVMNSHDTNFIMLLWKLEEGKGYQARLINSNRNNAEYRVVEQWAENIKKSGISKFDPTTGERIIDTEKAKALKEEMLALADVQDVSVHKAFLTKLETMLGMSIPASAKKVLYETTSYTTLLNNKFDRKGNFQDQFRWSGEGKPVGVFSALVHALTDKVTKEQAKEVDFKIEVNNPFEGPNKESAARFLAALVANHSETMFSSSFKNVEGKTIYGFSYHIPITSRLKEFNKGTELRGTLKKYAFSKDAYWLSNDSFKVHFEDMDGIKHNAKNSDGVVRNKMSDREQEFTSMMFFQQPSTEIAKFVGLTMSDKTRSPIIEAPKFKVFLDKDELNGVKVTKKALSQSTKDEIAKLVKSEAARIVLIHDKIKNAKDTNTTEELMQELGPQYYYGSQYFYFFPQLNDILYKDGVMQADMLVSEELNVLIESALDAVVDTINETVDSWLAEGIVEVIPNKKGKNSIKHKFNKDYVNSKNTEGYSAESLVAFAAADLEINYILFNANMMQVVQGDPALYYAPKFNKEESIQKRIEMVMDEYQKREAKDAAPGELGSLNWTITSPTGEQYLSKYTYNVVFALDDNHGTLTEGYLSKIPAYTSKLDRTDAQEYTTVLEHINVLANHGRIPDDIYSAIRAKVEKAGKGGYYTLSKEELDIILQPMKPVQVVHKAKEIHEHSYYIKSSSFPLVPQLTKGLDLDKIRVSMEIGDVDRIAFVTATKTGYHNTVSLFNSDGTVKENLEFQPQEKHQLHRKGFSIQQDVPYDPTKHEITVVSQMDRLILQGLSDEIFSFNGHKDYTGKTLKTLKENIRGQLMDMSRKELFTKVGVEVVNGKPYVANMDKFLEGIREEARDRGWSVNDIMSLNIVDGKIVVPLAFNNSADRIESLITSMFNRVIKQKINGKSLVQASSSGFKNNVKTLEDLITDDKEGIIWIKGTDNDFDPKKGLTYVNKDNGKLAQVILPWKFQAEIEKFLVPGTNTLDMTKVDKELLQIIGARIPNQGHSSQLSIQIVGFLPKLMGDLIIVPGEITKQMGSDFDVDKLYTYIFNHVVNDEGKLVKVPAFINKEGELDSKAAKEWVKANFSKETMPSAKFLQRASLQNAYIGIHLAVLSNPKVMKLMTEPLDADDLKTTGKVAQETIDRGLFISRRRQLKDFKKQQAGKDGVAIFSRAVVGAAMIEDYNLRLTTQDDKGKRIDRPFTGFKEDGAEKPLQLGKLSGVGKSNFKGEIRTKIKNLIIQQSGAVDNAKDPVLAMNGLDPATFNVSIVISMLQDGKGNALNLEYNSYFLRQEIIKEYVSELKKLSDTLNDKFVPDRKGEAADIVREKFIEKSVADKIKALNKWYEETIANVGIEKDAEIEAEYNKALDELIKIRKTLSSYKITGKAFSPKDLTNLLETKEKNSTNYLQDQLEILEHFLYLDAVGQELSEIYTALSTESKGLGKNYWEVKLRQEQLESLDRKSIIAGAGEILKDSQSGKIAGYVNDTISLLSHQFPYNTATFNTIISTIENESGRTRTDVEFRQLMWENFKSFMFSNTELDTVTEDKNSLFYGDNSVAKQLKKYAETTEGKKNKFVQKLRVKTAVDTNRPDLVLFNAAIAERTDEQELVKHFIDLIISPNEEVRNLAERLINYTYAIGGIQKALQFVKYVPVPYLMTTNFGSKLVELSNLMNEENDIIDSNRFIEQFYQHNPEKARKHNTGLKEFANIYKNGVTFNINKDNTQHLKKIENKKEVFVNYITIRDTKDNKWILLKKESLEGNNLVYKSIPILGGWGKDYVAYNEYDFNSDNVTSTIPENNPEGVAQVKVKTTPSALKKEGEVPMQNPINIEVKAHEYAHPISEGKDALDYMLSKLQTERFKVLSPIFLKAENMFPKFRLRVDNQLKGASGTIVKGVRYSDNSIGINPNEHKRIAKVFGREVNNEDLERTLIHELTHVVTVDLYKKFYLEGHNHPLLTPKVIEAFKQIETLFKVANSKLSEADKKLVAALKKDITAEMSMEDKTGLYGFTSVTEFMSEVLTKKEFQERLNKMEFNSQKTMLQRFTEFIQKIFNEFVKLVEQDLGTTVDQKSVLAHSLLEVVGLVNEIGNIQEVNKTDLTSSENVNNQIYSQLGSKTVSKEAPNVVIKPWSELKDATKAITSRGIVSTRIKNSNEHFGNPFSHDPAGKAYGLIKTETVQEAVENYIDWVINGVGNFGFEGDKRLTPEEFDFLENQEERRQWIKNQLESGELKDKPILYYKELGEPSHATALDYLINKYNWNKPDEFLELAEQVQKEIESNITTSPIFKQHGTDYRFQLKDGEAISGEYYQSGQGWRSMNPKNVKNKYKELLESAELSSMLETLIPKVEGGEKNVIVPEGSNPNNTIIFEDDNNVYLMNDGQQKAYDSVLKFLSDRILKTNEPLNLQELLKFVEGNNLAKEYSNVIPKQLWDNMIGIIGKGGTGKTTVIKKIIEDFIQNNRGNNRYFGVNVQFATPTHTAATVLQESLGVNSEGVRTGGVHTIASLTGRKELVEGSLNMISKEAYLDEIKKGFRMPISKIQILVFDESSMFSIEHMQDIIRRLQEEKELGIKGTPIMIFMGDYRQLPPIQGNAKKPDLEGVISSTLFTHPDKYSELSQIMRSSEEDMHKVFDVVGNQITTRRNAFIKGTTIPQFDWKKYDEVTSKSSKNVLIVNNEEGIIDDYTDELVNNDNPYHIFWIHYNKLDKPVTQNLFNKIRRNYFKKLGVTNIPETFIKGDYVQYMEPIETTTINDGNLGISAGTIKPQSRHKIKDIIKETVNFKDLLVAAKLDKFVPYFDSNITVTSGTLILHNRQGKDRAIKFLDDIIATEEWIKSTTTRGKDVVVTLKTQDGKVITKSKPIPGYLVMQNPDVFKIFFKDVNKVFKPSYIGSSHTAQGNSIKTVIVGEYNIRENAAKGVPIKDILSSLYTALTRASKKIIIIKGSGINIVNNQETFTDFIDSPPIDNMDISNFPVEEEMSISPLPTQTKSLSLGTSVSKFMNNLSKEQREVMREMINKGQIKFKCS